MNENKTNLVIAPASELAVRQQIVNELRSLTYDFPDNLSGFTAAWWQRNSKSLAAALTLSGRSTDDADTFRPVYTTRTAKDWQRHLIETLASIITSYNLSTVGYELCRLYRSGSELVKYARELADNQSAGSEATDAVYVELVRDLHSLNLAVYDYLGGKYHSKFEAWLKVLAIWQRTTRIIKPVFAGDYNGFGKDLRGEIGILYQSSAWAENLKRWIDAGFLPHLRPTFSVQQGNAYIIDQLVLEISSGFSSELRQVRDAAAAVLHRLESFKFSDSGDDEDSNDEDEEYDSDED